MRRSSAFQPLRASLLPILGASKSSGACTASGAASIPSLQFQQGPGCVFVLPSHISPSTSAFTEKHAGRFLSTSSTNSNTLRAVFLGPPGVGKGTYASRIAKHLGVAHIATGDLIREEIKAKTEMGLQIQSVVSKGQLVPDDLIFGMMHKRLAQESSGSSNGGFILDGFPRTRQQAEAVVSSMHMNLALNLVLREEVLVAKCLGRRACSRCGKSYNIADIQLPANPSLGRPQIIMPPLPPPPQCSKYMETRADDTEEVIRHRLQVYKDQSAPVEEAFREAGVLRSFELTEGIPQTLPRLLEFVQPYCFSSTAAPRWKQQGAAQGSVSEGSRATAHKTVNQIPKGHCDAPPPMHTLAVFA